MLRDITIAYGSRVVLSHVDADIPRSQVVSIVGPNGSGKSTLLKAIAGLIPVAAGDITLFDSADRPDAPPRGVRAAARGR